MNIECHDYDSLLPMYVNGVLDMEQRADMERHLRDCMDCRNEMEFLEVLHEEMPDISSDMEHPAVADRAARELQARIHGHHRRRYVAMAATVLLAVGTATGVAVNEYLTRPVFQTVTNETPAATSKVMVSITLRTQDRTALRNLLGDYNASVMSNDTENRTLLLEIPLTAESTPEQLRDQLRADRRIMRAELVESGK